MNGRKFRTTISINEDLLEACREEAEADAVSLSAWISRVLAWEINHCVKQETPDERCYGRRKTDKKRS
jgi:hypothetical protein